jgi:hypothetical protein
MQRFFTVDRFLCWQMGERMREIPPPPVRRHNFELVEEAVWFEIIFTSICHGTNWDDLYRRLGTFTERHRFDLALMASLDLSGFREQVHGAAEDIDRSRWLTFKAVAQFISAEWKPPCFGLGGRLDLGGVTGFYAWLDRLACFRADPLRKKSRVLVHQLLQYDLVDVADPDNVLPAVDYHINRYYLRTGRVRPVTIKTAGLLQEHRLVRSDIEASLRRAVEEAMKDTASGAKMRIDHLNFYEWQIARSFCLRDEPRCSGPFSAGKPILGALLDYVNENGGCCPAREICIGAGMPELRRLFEPKPSNHYY